MNHPVIDESKCLNDDLCARVCPSKTLLPYASGRSRFAEEVQCIGCGHCVSVCPQAALSFGSVPAKGLEPLPAGGRVDVEQASLLLKGRRSIRLFRREPMPRDAIARVLSFAEYAPSGMNAQPIAWTVLYERARVEAVARAVASWMREAVASKSPLVGALYIPAMLERWEAGEDVICRGAPHLVVAHAPEALPSGVVAGAISVTYLELAARALGAGTCWAGFVYLAAGASSEVRTLLQVPVGRRAAGIAMLGTPAIAYRRFPPRKAPEITWSDETH